MSPPRRLRWGPHAHEAAEQVVLRDPQYVCSILSDHPGGVLATIFRELILAFDAQPLTCRCARCGRRADGVCAYLNSVVLVGYCELCVRLSPHTRPEPAMRVSDYEAALRHVATSFQRGHRIQMRRIVGALVEAKGGPTRLTEAAARSFLAA